MPNRLLFVIYIFCVLTVFAIETKAEDTHSVLFSKYGVYRVGPNTLSLQNGSITINFGNGNTLSAVQYFSFGNSRWYNSSQLSNSSLAINQEEQSVKYTADLNTKAGNIHYSLDLIPRQDGKIVLTAILDMQSEPESKNRGNMRVSWPISLVGARKIIAGGQDLDADGGKVATGWQPIAKLSKQSSKVMFLSNAPEQNVTINVDTADRAHIAQNDGQFHLVVSPHQERDRQVIRLVIDLGKSNATMNETFKRNTQDIKTGKYYWGVNFADNRFEVPHYEKSKNLIQNPSFEAGLRYFAWDIRPMPMVEKYTGIYDVDEQNSRFGSKSLRMQAFEELDSYTGVSTFPIPLKRNQTYTVSFFAKANRDGVGLRVRAWSVGRGRLPLSRDRFNLSTTWQRFSAEIQATQMGGSLSFCPMSGKSGEIWLDGIQLEEGVVATSFEEKSFLCDLTTSANGNFIEYGKPINAKLKIQGKPDSEGNAIVTVRDFQDHIYYEGTFPFQINEDGSVTYPLPLDEKLPRGIFAVEVTLRGKDGYRDTDYFRVALMNFMAGDHKHKNLFCNNLREYTALRYPKMLARLKQIGVGSYGASGAWRIASAYAVEQMKKHNIHYTVKPITMNTRGPVLKYLTLDGTRYIQNFDLSDLNQDPSLMTPEYLLKLKEVVRDNAREMSWISEWNPFNEPQGKLSGLDIGQLAQLADAMVEGLREASPKVKVGTPPPSSLQHYPWQEEFLRACQEYGIEWDFADIHIYRYSPESPDLDRDTREYLEMLDRVGLDDVPVYYNEGMFYTPYVIPAWDLNVNYDGASPYYLRSPSYDMGWGEIQAAAFDARTWLICLKYADRVKVAESFNNIKYTFMDYELTPFAVQKVINTLARLLGNADFKHDIRFAPYVRAYVFEDEDERPVVALWSHMPEVDRGIKSAPKALVPFDSLQLQLFNMMEAPLDRQVDANGNWVLPASPFPIFIRGQRGDLEAIYEALNRGRLQNSTVSPVMIDVQSSTKDTVLIRVSNLLTRPFSGMIRIGDEEARDIALKPTETIAFRYPLTEPIRADEVIRVSVPVSIRGHQIDSQPVSNEVTYRVLLAKKISSVPMKIDGNLDDWGNLPSTSMSGTFTRNPPEVQNPIDKNAYNYFEAASKIAWDETALYLAIKVVDEEFISTIRKNNQDNASLLVTSYDNDVVQLFFDTLGDARKSFEFKGFGPDDYQYHLFMNPDTEAAAVYRAMAPDPQLSGLLKSDVLEPGIKSAFSRTDDGYIWEAAFPARYLKPLELREGSSFGLGIQVNNHDGNHWIYSKVNNIENARCYKNPVLFPSILLVDDSPSQ